MGVNIKISTHRRNPSGFHNKIRWFLSTSSRNLKNMEILYGYIDKERMTLYQKFSWKTACFTAACCVRYTNCNLINYRQERRFILNLDIGHIYKNCKEICEKDNKPIDPNMLDPIIIKKQIVSAFDEYFSPEEKYIGGGIYE